MVGYDDKEMHNEENQQSNSEDNVKRDEVFSSIVRAGKRTYFFDVKSTRSNDYFLTITESKKRFRRDGRYYYEKHKIFLYKEDFEKFEDSLKETIAFIKANQPEKSDISVDDTNHVINTEKTTDLDEKTAEFSDVSFDDLDDDNKSE